MTETQASVSTEEVTSEENPTIQLVDLSNALRIIDVAAKRGAFEGAELTSVGAVRDKLAVFLQAVTPAQDNEVTEETAPAEAPAKTSKKKSSK